MSYKLKTLNDALIKSYISVFNLDPLKAKLLVAKGFTGQEIIQLLMPQKAMISAETLTHGKEAVQRIDQFLAGHAHSTIWIFGDYDVDGMTASLILQHALEAYCQEKGYSCQVLIHLPDRADGYGIKANWAQALKTETPTMVITVDNGTSAKEAIAVLNERQIPVIVTDHHQPESAISDCLIINPTIYPEDPNKHLAGCGVAFKLGILLVGFDSMASMLDILTLGTIGDMMPMTLENIAFCQMGLNQINSPQCHPVIQYLKNQETLTYKDLAFDIIPKLNSCGRMGCIYLGLEYLLNPNAADAQLISELNEERKTTVKQYMEQLKENQTTVLVLKECGLGIAGIIAGQLSQLMQKNVIVLTEAGNGLLKGSGRGFGDMLGQLKTAAQQFKTLTASGHREACGVTIQEREAQAFETYYNQLQQASGSITETDEAIIEVDMSLTLDEVTNRTLKIIQSLPYDRKKLTEPIFLIEADLKNKERTKKNPANAWLYLQNGNRHFKIWAKDMSEKAFSLKRKKNLKFIATLDKDFMNPNNTTLKILDIVE